MWKSRSNNHFQDPEKPYHDAFKPIQKEDVENLPAQEKNPKERQKINRDQKYFGGAKIFRHVIKII